jgi:protein-S-isoprenylcysteine O-methyltransferase Ste14
MLYPLILIIATILYCYLHSLTASTQFKTRFREWFGEGVDRWYRLAYNLFAGISFLPILWLVNILPDHRLYSISMPWILMTTLVQIAAAVIIVIGIDQTGALSFLGIRQISSIDQKGGSFNFIDRGLYRWVRHPLYTGGLLMIWLAPNMSINLLVLFITFTIYFVLGARLEEERLIEELGEDYIQYQERVPMLIPSPRRRV